MLLGKDPAGPGGGRTRMLAGGKVNDEATAETLACRIGPVWLEAVACGRLLARVAADGAPTMTFQVRSLRARITAAIRTFVQRARPDSRYVVARR
jgi:hypothetical protein